MEQASEALLALKPVTFRYKKEIDPKGVPQFGLVAEEVEKVNPKLVVRDKEGKVNTVRYEAVNAMLLNEFLKEHRKVERLEGTVTQQQKQIEALTAVVQKVGDQVALSKPAPQCHQPLKWPASAASARICLVGLSNVIKTPPMAF